MVDLDSILGNLPEVEKPKRRLSFNEKLKWTGMVLILYFILGQLKLYGLSPQAIDYFQNLRAIVAGNFGSIITLGISPIVTASIILQLLQGVDLLPFDITTAEGRRRFQGTQKLVTIGFTIFEAAVYVISGGLPPSDPSNFGLTALLIVQLSVGGLLIIVLDEVISKWGFGSGVSLFIAAGVSTTIVVSSLNPMPNPTNPDVPSGMVPFALSRLAMGDPEGAVYSLMPIFFTVFVFTVVVYVQAMKVEIPLTFARVRGYTTKWPLRFVYTSNIPVILAAAVLANLQLWAGLLDQNGFPYLGTFAGGGNTPTGGLAFFIDSPRGIISRELLDTSKWVVYATGVSGAPLAMNELWFYQVGVDASNFMSGLTDPTVMTSIYLGCPLERDKLAGLGYSSCRFIGDGSLGELLRAIIYTVFMIIGAVIFSVFWVRTSNMDAKAVAKQIKDSNMSVRGFRRDPRMMEAILNRYIPALTVMGGAFVGLLAAFADLTGSVGGGTGILLTVMIVYNLYEEIHTQHMVDMYPALRRFMKG